MSGENMIQIARPDASELVRENLPLVERAKALVIDSAESHGVALNTIKACRAVEKELTDRFEKPRKDLDTAKKSLLATRDGMVGPFAEARSIVSRKADDYEAAERRRAEAEARAAEAEARRIEAANRAAEQERALAAALEAEQAGDGQQAADLLAEAEEVESAPVFVPVVAPRAQIATVAGVSTQTRYSAEVVDMGMLVAHVATHPDMLNLLEPDMPALNSLARSLRDAMRIPGVRAVASTVRSTRG